MYIRNYWTGCDYLSRCLSAWYQSWSPTAKYKSRDAWFMRKLINAILETRRPLTRVYQNVFLPAGPTEVYRELSRELRFASHNDILSPAASIRWKDNQFQEEDKFTLTTDQRGIKYRDLTSARNYRVNFAGSFCDRIINKFPSRSGQILFRTPATRERRGTQQSFRNN